jgi:hypothetical protein
MARTSHIASRVRSGAFLALAPGWLNPGCRRALGLK